MVKKIEINLTNKLFYTFAGIIAVLALVIILIFTLGIGVYAFGTSNPLNFGHTAGELDLSGGVSGDAIFNGKVGIGDSTPSSKLDVAGTGSFTSDLTVGGDIFAGRFFGDGSGLTDLNVRITGQDVCDSTNNGLLRYRSDLCSGDDIKSSYFDMCVKTGSDTYSWKTISTSTWADISCNLDGCPAGQNYYQCTGEFVQPGCYSSRPADCYFQEPTCGEYLC